MQNTPKTRRRLISLAFVPLAAASLGLADYIYRQVRPGPVILDSIKVSSMGQQERQEFDRSVQEYYSTYTPHPDHINVKSLEYQTWLSFLPDRARLPELERTLGASIEDAVIFCDSEYIKRPKVEFRIPLRKANIAEKEKTIRVYLVSGIEQRMIATNELRYGNKKVAHMILRRLNQNGFERRRQHYNLTENGYELRFSEGFAVINIASEQYQQHEAVVAEVLHHLLGPYTNVHLTAAAKQIREAKKEDSKKKLDELSDLWTEREETVVHALTFAWLERQRDIFGSHAPESALPESGSPKEKIAKRMRIFAGKSPYFHVPGMKLKVDRLGPQKVIELYVTNPEKLF